jgi:hypothetical protein
MPPIISLGNAVGVDRQTKGVENSSKIMDNRSRIGQRSLHARFFSVFS